MKSPADKSRYSSCAGCGEPVVKKQAVVFQGKTYHPISCAPKAIEEFGKRARRLAEGLR